jgi:NitT/TauT family transport system substrate-binding protein
MAAAAAGCSASRSSSAATRDGEIQVLLNPSQIAYLPVFYAVERGYFVAAGLKVALKFYSGSANAQLPLLARGDVDVGGVIAAPALFNQAAAGFGIQLLSALTVPERTHIDGVALMIREDVWQRGSVHALADLRGHSIDAAAEGNPIDLLIRFALMQGGLSPRDVRLSYKIRTPSDILYLFQEKQVDLAGVSEPTATLIAKRGLARKWIGYRDVIPWYQDTFLGASENFSRARPKEAALLVQCVLRAARDVGEAQGQWTESTLAAAAKWSHFKPADLRAMGGVPYWSPDGAVDTRSLERVQRYWMERRLVRTQADLSVLTGFNRAAHA